MSGKLPPDLKAQVTENLEPLKEHLTWNRPTGVQIVKHALSFLAPRYIKWAENPFDGYYQSLIDEAFVAEDMWALRVAIRGWVLSWVEAINRETA